jgi:Tol biopolymer transport system component
VACQDERGVELSSLVPGVTPSSVQILANVTSEDFSSPTWSPDGRRLALISGSLEGGCSIGVYSLAPADVSARLLAVLTFPQFILPSTPRSGCLLAEVSWSPDGTWFAVVARGIPLTIYRMPVPGLLPLTVPASGTPVVITVTPDQLTIVGHTRQYIPPAWSMKRGQNTVSFVDADTFDIVQVDIASLLQVPVLHIPSGTVCGLAWTPDSRQLAFVQCALGSADFGPQPSQMYVYTSSS